MYNKKKKIVDLFINLVILINLLFKVPIWNAIKMILGEALLFRADLHRQILSLKERLETNSKIQEGEKPAEPPGYLFEQLKQVVTDFERIVIAINKANYETKLSSGKSLTEALAHRDVLRQMHKTLITVARHAIPDSNRYSEREIRWISIVDVKDLRKQANEIAKEIREINADIQKINWVVDIEY